MAGWRPGQLETCVFCGRSIEAGELRVGRGESAAHAACADRGLGDDRFWDQVAARMGAGDEDDEAGGDERVEARDGMPARPASSGGMGGGGRRTAESAAGARTGCLGAALQIALVVWLVALALMVGVAIG